jgi:hypothetical protein
MVWAGGIHQEMERAAGGDVTTVGLNFGAKVAAGGLSLVGSFYNGEAIGTVRTLASVGGNAFICAGVTCTEADNDGYYVQAMYNLNGATNVGVSYGESNQDADAAGNIVNSNELTTLGVYHDVNSWLKVVAEYNMQSGFQNNDALSLGGFIFW